MIRWIETHVSLSVRAGLALFGAVLLWSSSFIALKVAVAAFNPMVMVFGRMVSSLAALVLLRFTVWRGSAAPLLLDRRVTRREWRCW
ncbi:MAG: EamA family transporter [Bilophila sp.]